VTVTQVGSSWVTSYLGDHVLFDIQADATTADTALAGVAADPPSFAATKATYLAYVTGGNWGHIKTLAAPSLVAAAISEVDGGAAS
jgi:hypothetical protein